MSQRWHDT
jgi:hypothetical protein